MIEKLTLEEKAFLFLLTFTLSALFLLVRGALIWLILHAIRVLFGIEWVLPYSFACICAFGVYLMTFDEKEAYLKWQYKFTSNIIHQIVLVHNVACVVCVVLVLAMGW